jgi:TPP-dependent pyruvate/acetoin dehydrogenase alpha subunit
VQLDDPPEEEVETSRKELLRLYRQMNVMRRTEISADLLYKTKEARGFLHLADGQVVHQQMLSGIICNGRPLELGGR